MANVFILKQWTDVHIDRYIKDLKVQQQKCLNKYLLILIKLKHLPLNIHASPSRKPFLSVKALL